MHLAEIWIKELSDQANLVTLENDVDKLSIKSQRHQSIPDWLIIRIGDLLIVTGQRLKTQIQTV
jgi:hypothetical protein